jgi:hypothetical protein
LKVRFLADANFNQKIVRGLLIRKSAIDFELPEATMPEKTPDPQVLEIAESLGRVLVTLDVNTMPRWFQQCVEQGRCAGLLLVPEKLSIRDGIEVDQMLRLPL